MCSQSHFVLIREKTKCALFNPADGLCGDELRAVVMRSGNVCAVPTRGYRILRDDVTAEDADWLTIKERFITTIDVAIEPSAAFIQMPTPFPSPSRRTFRGDAILRH